MGGLHSLEFLILLIMKITTICLLAAVFSSVGVWAGELPTVATPPVEAEKSTVWENEITLGYDSHYVFRGELLQKNVGWAQWSLDVPLSDSINLNVNPWYYRTTAGAEIDLLLEFAPGRLWAVEVKHSSKPVPSKGFHFASADVGAQRRIVVYTGRHRYSDSNGVEYLPLVEALSDLRALNKLP